jgi:hypothetical protein
MVLQRAPGNNNIWGWADANAKIALQFDSDVCFSVVLCFVVVGCVVDIVCCIALCTVHSVDV